MFNKRNIIAAISAVMDRFGALKLTPRKTGNTIHRGINPKKGVIALHRDIKRQKLSRYPKVHQGARECKRRIRQSCV